MFAQQHIEQHWQHTVWLWNVKAKLPRVARALFQITASNLELKPSFNLAGEGLFVNRKLLMATINFGRLMARKFRLENVQKVDS